MYQNYPTRSLSPNTNSNLELVAEYLASKGYGDHDLGENNTEFGHSAGTGHTPPGSAPVLQDTQTWHAQTLYQLDPRQMDLGVVTPDRVWRQSNPLLVEPASLSSTPPSSDASPPYSCPSLQASGGREQSPNLFPQAEGCSLNRIDWQNGQFINTLTPVNQSCGPSDGLESNFDQLLVNDPSNTSGKSRRGAPHRHKRQFLEGEEKLKRNRELNNEASRIHRHSKRTNNEQRLNECQRLELRNQQLREKCCLLEKEALMYREVVEPFLRHHGYEPAARYSTLPQTPDPYPNPANHFHHGM